MSVLSSLLVEDAVRAALLEDLGRAGDITTDSVVAEDVHMVAVLAARQPGRVAGVAFAETAFRLVDAIVHVEVEKDDGRDVEPGDVIATLRGPARAILTGERVALNYLCHLSGIATATRAIIRAVEGHKARVTCTRKTTPGLRAFEKFAVRMGGGANHRFGLDDGVLIKDNHIAVAGGIRPAIEKARAGVGHMVKVEVEVDTLDQLREALEAGIDAVLLDNMTPEQLKEAVTMIDGRCVAEASGRVTAETAGAIAAAGVDVISAGWLTHSAPALDIGLDVVEG